MRKTRLLLVEDDEDDYIITRDLLNDISFGEYQLDWAPNLTNAREKLSSNHHDVCLLDYSLGSEDGLSLLMEAPALGFTGPIIMLTGQDDAQLDEEALTAGAVDYLVKSQLNASRLARAIRYAVSRREMELERAERLKAESENRAKSEFLAQLSHELRTPLTSILGYTDLLFKQVTEHNSTQHLHVIKRNGRHLLNLLNDILDLSKIEAGKLEIDRHSIQLADYLSDLFQLIRVKALDKDIDLQFVANQPLPRYIFTDPTRLRQILMNLLGNAIKFTDHGKVELLIHYDQNFTSGNNSQLHFDIVDSGIGIPEDQVNKLFSPFSQANNANGRSEQGTGLGLVISRQLAKRLGGDIKVTSELGRGSRFSLSIDCGPANEIELVQLDLGPTNNQPPKLLSITRLNGRILVVDDLADVRNLLGFLIENAGARVDYADNGPKAIELVMAAEATSTPFDLILMDMQMPGMNGIEATQYLREKGFKKPILALTAATMKGERERCLAAGCSDHLSKPIEESRLLERITFHLDQYRAPNKATENLQLLLVEDNDDARAITSLLIQNLGWNVLEAGTGTEAIEILTEQQPNLVIMDINLPDRNGIDLARNIKASHQDMPLIALSGQDIEPSQRDFKLFEDYYLKPVTLDKLKQLLSHASSIT